MKKLALLILPALLITGAVYATNYKDYDKGAILVRKSEEVKNPNTPEPSEPVQPTPEVSDEPKPGTEETTKVDTEPTPQQTQTEKVLSMEETIKKLFLETHKHTDDANWECMQQIIYLSGTMRLPYTSLYPIVTNRATIAMGACNALKLKQQPADTTVKLNEEPVE